MVADNGSTDDTSKVIESFNGCLPLSSVYEPRLGKNYALNAALDLIEGDLTVLTDDDAFPRPDWLIQLQTAADNLPAYSMFGGAVAPRWEVPPPSWIQWMDLGPIFTITPSSMGEGELASVTMVQGPNMAIRSSIFRSGVRFDPSIGPSGSSYPMGSETEILLRLGRQGHKAWHVEGAVVEHWIRREQLTKAWVLRRAIRYGRGWYRMAPSKKLWAGVPPHLFREIPKEFLRMSAASVLFRPDVRLRSRWRLNYLFGEAMEARILARGAGAAKKSAA